MTLRKKTLAIIGITLLVLIGVLALTARFIILGSFERLEERYVFQNIHRTQAFMTENLANLSSTARDWATWDDTYKFIKEQKSEVYRCEYCGFDVQYTQDQHDDVYRRIGPYCIVKGI